MTREWNFDMTRAPHGRYRLVPTGKGKSTRKVFEPAKIIVAGQSGVVTVSRWLDDANRWEMFTRETPPIAWMPFDGPRQYVDDKGKTRYALDLPPHPTMAESWFDVAMREQRGAAA